MITTLPEYSVYTKPEIENAVLGGLMLRTEETRPFLPRLSDALFSSAENRAIFRKILELDAARKKIDMIVMCDELPALTAQIVQQFKDAGYPGMYGQYIGILQEAKSRRDIYRFAEKVREDAGNEEVPDLMERIRQFAAVQKVVEDEQDKSAALFEAYDELFNHDPDRYVKCGIPGIDKMLGGYEPGTLNIIGARPATGKSVFVMDLAMHAADQKKRALIINREMKKKNLFRRMISSAVGLDAEKIKAGNLTQDEISQFLEGMTYIQNASVEVLNRPYKPSEIKGSVDAMMASGGLDVLIVDYLQRLSPDRKTFSRDEAIGSISWALKEIAMEYNIPVILVSQLNRDASGKRPNSAHLRESGNIEQDADSVMLLHRPEPSDDLLTAQSENMAKCKGLGGVYVEALLDKNREGARAVIPMMFSPQHMKFVQM